MDLISSLFLTLAASAHAKKAAESNGFNFSGAAMAWTSGRLPRRLAVLRHFDAGGRRLSPAKLHSDRGLRKLVEQGTLWAGGPLQGSRARSMLQQQVQCVAAQPVSRLCEHSKVPGHVRDERARVPSRVQSGRGRRLKGLDTSARAC